MKRKHKKKALYEVFSRAESKSRHGSGLEKLHIEEHGLSDYKSSSGDSARYTIKQKTKLPIRPRLLQLNAGRVEMSVPYPLAIAVLLGIILLVLMAFRLGELAYEKGMKKASAEASSQDVAEDVRFEAQIPTTEAIFSGEETTEASDSTGNNRIVIQTWKTRTQLEPVKNYFAGFGIETEIRRIGDVYYLLTKEKYENPHRVGTDGYAARMKIIELGAEYKAPAGYGSFGPKPFHDAYGMKFND